jgi:hypothetical protein
MNHHPGIRQRTAPSGKWPRWRRVQFQRPFSGLMGSAALEAIVSNFLEQISSEWRAAMASEKNFASH